MRSTIGEKLPLDAARAEMIWDLVASETLIPECRLRRPQLADVEIADTDEASLPSCDKGLKRPHGFGNGIVAGPVQKVQIEPFGPKPFQAPLARAQCPFI